jgi:hypothetical protein
MSFLAWLQRILTPERIRAFQDWRRQPTTVAGFSIVSGAATAWCQHSVTGYHALAIAVTGLLMMIFPDNANRQASAVLAAPPAIVIQQGLPLSH